MKPIEEYGDDARYHDLVVNGEVISKGWRECQARWDFIAPYLPSSGVIVDLGSNAGYFAQRAAESPDRLIWSMESAPRRIEIQRDLLVENAAANVVLTAREMRILDWLKIESTTNRIDAIMALSVLEYLPPHELIETLRVFSRISPVLIVEFCDPDETGVGGDPETLRVIRPFDEYLKLFFEHVEAIGETSSQIDPTKSRVIYLCRRAGPLYRTDLFGWIGGGRGRRHTLAHHNGHWIMNGRVDLDVAISLWNLMYFGLAYPEPENLAAQFASVAEQAVKEYSGEVIDIHPRNTLVTPHGVKLIDLLERFGVPIRDGVRRDDPEFDLYGWASRQIAATADAILRGSLMEFSTGFERWR